MKVRLQKLTFRFFQETREPEPESQGETDKLGTHVGSHGFNFGFSMRYPTRFVVQGRIDRCDVSKPRFFFFFRESPKLKPKIVSEVWGPPWADFSDCNRQVPISDQDFRGFAGFFFFFGKVSFKFENGCRLA